VTAHHKLSINTLHNIARREQVEILWPNYTIWKCRLIDRGRVWEEREGGA